MTDSHIVAQNRFHQSAPEFQPDLRHTRTPLLAYELSVDSGRLVSTDTAQPTTASPACFMIAVALLVFSVTWQGRRSVAQIGGHCIFEGSRMLVHTF